MVKTEQTGLYDATNEHDACGVGMVVNIHGNKSHELVDSALKVLENMRHRGAEGADNYNPQIQISVVSGTKRSIFRQKNKTKRSKKRLHTTLIKPEQKVNEDLCSGFIVS